MIYVSAKFKVNTANGLEDKIPRHMTDLLTDGPTNDRLTLVRNYCTIFSKEKKVDIMKEKHHPELANIQL